MGQIHGERIGNQGQAIDQTADPPGPGTVLARVIHIEIIRSTAVHGVVGVRIAGTAISRYLAQVVRYSHNTTAGKVAGIEAAVRTGHPDAYGVWSGCRRRDGDR